jgi:hypothetical protein
MEGPHGTVSGSDEAKENPGHQTSINALNWLMERPAYRTSQIQGLEVTENGKVNIAVVPERPHCPCCLFDLRDLRLKIAQIKGVTSVELIVTGVPAAERWTRVLNPQ